MRSLIVLLLVLGAYSTCTNDEFRWFASCMPCEESYCKTCQGTNKCKECPPDIEDSAYGECDKCIDDNSIPLNKVCVPCSSLGSESGNGMDCDCKANDPNCCKGENVYKWGTDGTGCSPCSFDMVGCTRCSYNKEEKIFTCKECSDDYVMEGSNERTVCLKKSYSGYLYAAIGILISLLTLI